MKTENGSSITSLEFEMIMYMPLDKATPYECALGTKNIFGKKLFSSDIGVLY